MRLVLHFVSERKCKLQPLPPGRSDEDRRDLVLLDTDTGDAADLRRLLRWAAELPSDVGSNRGDNDEVDFARLDTRHFQGFPGAGTERSDIASVSAAMRRSRMPVRLRIHSSLVSTIVAISSFVSTRSGTWQPRPVIEIGRPSPGDHSSPTAKVSVPRTASYYPQSRAPSPCRPGRAPSRPRRPGRARRRAARSA